MYISPPITLILIICGISIVGIIIETVMNYIEGGFAALDEVSENEEAEQKN